MDSVIILGAKYLFLTVPLLFLLAIIQAGKKSKKQLVISVVLAVIFAAILDKIASKLYYDPRPFVTQNIKPLVVHAADNGFPSEHTLFSITIAAVLYQYRPKLGALALAIAVVVGIARVAAHVHSPIDILGSILMGVAAAYAGTWLARRYFLDAKSS